MSERVRIQVHLDASAVEELGLGDHRLGEGELSDWIVEAVRRAIERKEELQLRELGETLRAMKRGKHLRIEKGLLERARDAADRAELTFDEWVQRAVDARLDRTSN